MAAQQIHFENFHCDRNSNRTQIESLGALNKGFVVAIMLEATVKRAVAISRDA
jgi:hypothetical protein